MSWYTFEFLCTNFKVICKCLWNKPIILSDCTIYSKGDFIFCECSRGIRLKVDALSTVYITVVKDQVAPESLKGICGNFNDDATGKLTVWFPEANLNISLRKVCVCVGGIFFYQKKIGFQNNSF